MQSLSRVLYIKVRIYYSIMHFWLLIVNEPFADFYGTDIFMYYWYVVKSFMRDYSWQVRLSYAIILGCMIAMIFLALLFWRQLRIRRAHEQRFNHCMRTYGEAFMQILEDPVHLTGEQMMEICDAEDEDMEQYSGMLFAEVILNLRMSMHNVEYEPNLQTLCEITGARQALEACLKARKHVVQALQVINTLPLYINEGLLAVYTASKDQKTQDLARITHMIISKTEPYLYMLDDMNKSWSPWYPITIHRILGWKKAQGQPMAPLHMLASECTDPNMAAFLIEEISYYGSDDEKGRLYEFFTDKRLNCRMKAVEMVARLRIPNGENLIFDSYHTQPQPVRRVMQKALLSYHQERFSTFYEDIFFNTPSQESRRIALKCLFYNTPESRARFEQLAKTAKPEDELLFRQISTLHELKESRAKQEAEMNQPQINQ